MTNKSSSKQHGLSSVHCQRPKSKSRVRNNKLKASIRKVERRSLQLKIKPIKAKNKSLT